MFEEVCRAHFVEFLIARSAINPQSNGCRSPAHIFSCDSQPIRQLRDFCLLIVDQIRLGGISQVLPQLPETPKHSLKNFETFKKFLKIKKSKIRIALMSVWMSEVIVC